VNWDAMPVDRDNLAPDPAPRYEDYDYTQSSWYRNYRQGQLGLDHDHDFEEIGKPKATKPTKYKDPKKGAKNEDPVVPAFDESKWLVEEAMGTSSGDLLWICQEEPDDAHATMVALIREVAKLRADVLQLRTLLGDA